jgi:hypothetical protein
VAAPLAARRSGDESDLPVELSHGFTPFPDRRSARISRICARFLARQEVRFAVRRPRTSWTPHGMISQRRHPQPARETTLCFSIPSPSVVSSGNARRGQARSGFVSPTVAISQSMMVAANRAGEPRPAGSQAAPLTLPGARLMIRRA